MNDEHQSDEMVVQLNMEHPYNKAIMEFIKTAPPGMVRAFFARMHRRSEFDRSMGEIGGLTKYRRKLVTRGMVRMFRAGYRSGFQGGVDQRGATNGTAQG